MFIMRNRISILLSLIFLEAVSAAAPVAPEEQAPGSKKAVKQDSKDADARRKAAAGQRGSLLKAGFQFVPSAIPSLAGNNLVTDLTDVTRRAAVGIRRRVDFSNGSQSLAVFIGLSQVSTSELPVIVDEYARDSQKAFDDRFVNGANVGITIGDQNLVDPDSTSFSVPSEIVFSRANIFVALWRTSDAAVNLKLMAQDIDAAIQALPDVTPVQLAAALPVIATFNADTTNLHPGGQANLTLTATDPGGAALKSDFVAPDGDTLESPLRYQAGSKIGVQTLAVVVSNPSLLYSEAGLSFNVTAP